MKVKVMAEDVRLGVVDEPMSCPIARALKRKLGKEVRVYEEECYIGPNGRGQYQRPLTLAASRFVRDFDKGRKVTPRTIEVWKP